MFQGLRISISVTRSLGSEFAQRQAQARTLSAFARQSRKKVDKAKMKAQQQRAAADVAGKIVPSGHTPLLYPSPGNPSPESSADAAGDMGMWSLSFRHLPGLVISQRAIHMRLNQQWLHPQRGSARMALFSKACPLLSGVSAYVADRCGTLLPLKAASAAMSPCRHCLLLSRGRSVHLSSSKASFLRCQ